MPGTPVGALKVAAARVGVTVDEYARHVAAGEKWCYRGDHWMPVELFGVDRDRYDGRSAACTRCRRTSTTPGPSKHERRLMRSRNLTWCCDCRGWLATALVRGSRCRPHINAERRRYYATNERFRRNIRQRVHARTRGVAPIPPDAQEMILEDFDGLCAYCDRPATTWDHIVAITEGGRTTPGNVVPACLTCNSSKNNRDVFEWMKRTGRTPKEAWCDRYILSFAGLYG